MTARKQPSRRSAPPTSKESEWYEALIGTPAKKWIAVASAAAAIIYLFGLAKPVVDSGPLPVPARSEVTDLQKTTDERFKSTKEGLDATLEVAKAANIAAQNANQKLDQSRLDRLIQQKVQLEGLLKMNDDPTLKQALEKTQIDIATMVNAIQAAAGPASALVATPSIK